VNQPANRSSVVRVPASSANLGAGFDVLGMALDLYLDIGTGDVPEGAHPVDQHHPAAKAFAGSGPGVDPTVQLWVRSAIPMARGLGFSGAARVGGAALAAIGDASDPAGALAAARSAVLDVAVRLEGHGDNAAASVFGGVVAWVDGRAITVRVGSLLAAATVVVWIPETTTSTERSRSALPDEVSRRDAVHNLGRMAQFVLAIEHDDPSLLAGATDDRLHQPARLAALPSAAAVIDAAVDAGAWCAWLSGSGPSVAFLTDDRHVDAVTSSLPHAGHVKRLRIASRGVHVLSPAER
jgi:homoserine kinase